MSDDATSGQAPDPPDDGVWTSAGGTEALEEGDQDWTSSGQTEDLGKALRDQDE